MRTAKLSSKKMNSKYISINFLSYLIQLPKRMDMECLNKEENNSNLLRDLSSGTLGTLQIHKSGKVTMKLSKNNQDKGKFCGFSITLYKIFQM